MITKIDGNFAFVIDKNDLIYFAFKNKEKKFFIRYILEKKHCVKTEEDFVKNIEYGVRKTAEPKPNNYRNVKLVRIGRFSGVMNDEYKKNELVFTSNVLDGQWKIKEKKDSLTGFVLLRII